MGKYLTFLALIFILNTTIRKLLLTAFLLLSLDSFATWSIIIVDTVTGEIGIAAASCTYSVYGIGGIVPGSWENIVRICIYMFPT